MSFLFSNRDPEETLAEIGLEACEHDLLRHAFAREGTLRDEEDNFTALLKLTNAGKELENATLCDILGKGGFAQSLRARSRFFRKGLGI